MEIKDLSQIQFASYNPRILSDHMGAALDASMTTFGDLSGITFNAQSQTLITGHQRLRILEKRYPSRVKIYIEHRFDAPDEYGTIATGFVAVEGTNLHLAYREVSWAVGTEKAANVAANKIEAQFDNDLLAQLNFELSQLENGDELLALTGQTEDEIAKLLGQTGVEPEPSEPQRTDDGLKTLPARFTDEQLVEVYNAIGLAKREQSFANEPNADFDANALSYICHAFIENRTSHNIETPVQPEPASTPAQPTVPPEAPLLDTIPTDYAA